MEDIVVVFSTFPDREVATKIAITLIDENLAACVGMQPDYESIYRWEGKVESAKEVLAFIKTTASAYPALETRLKELHPYQVPEILGVPVSQVHPAYAAWVREMTSAE